MNWIWFIIGAIVGFIIGRLLPLIIRFKKFIEQEKQI